MHGVDCLDEGYGITPQDLQDTVAKQGVELRKKDVVLGSGVDGRMTWGVAADFDGYLVNTPGISLDAAKWLCEEAGAMCIAGDTIGLEVLPSEEPDVFLPGARVHVRDGRCADHRGRRHGGDRGREAVRVRVPRNRGIPSQSNDVAEDGRERTLTVRRKIAHGARRAT